MHTKYHAKYYTLLAAITVFASASHISTAARKIITLREFKEKIAHSDQKQIATILEHHTVTSNDYTGKDVDETLSLAIKHHCPEIACALVLEKPHLVNTPMAHHFLIAATEMGHLKLVELLIAHGADLHAHSYHGYDALEIAVCSNASISHAIVRALILAGAGHQN